MSETEKLYFTYDQIHELIATSADKAKEFKPDYIIAIGGGGFIGGRIVRTYLGKPLLSVTVKLYDAEIDGVKADEPTVLQWLDEMNIQKIKGKRVLIVDEIDDSRVTLSYVVNKMVEHEVAAIGTFVIHNKLREKEGVLPSGTTYISCHDVPDQWVIYPWDNSSYTVVGISSQDNSSNFVNENNCC